MSDTPQKQVQSVNEVIDQVMSEAWKDKVSAGSEQIVDALETAGFVIVAKEPTEVMVGVGLAKLFGMTHWSEAVKVCYRAMIEARPR